MATEQAKLIIRGENHTDAAFRQVKSQMSQLDSASQKLTRTLGGLGLGLSLGLIIRQISADVIEAEQSEARLAATLKATGNVTGYTTKQLEALNDQLVKTSSFDDEGIRNAQAQLVKFGNISGDVFRRSIVLSADYASLLATDLPNAAQQLGRALTAPAVGLTFLERNVGKFSDATHTAITNLLQLGDVAGAQALILDELDKRIGGTAQTMNAGLTKATSDLKKSWDDMLEAIGRTGPVIGSAGSGGVLGFLTKVEKAVESIAKHGDMLTLIFKGQNPLLQTPQTAINSPAVAAAQQREQADQALAQANAKAAAEKAKIDANSKAAEDELTQTMTWFDAWLASAKQQEEDLRIGKIVGFSEEVSRANKEAIDELDKLKQKLDEVSKAEDAAFLQQAKQAADMAAMSQAREDEFNSQAALDAQLNKTSDSAKKQTDIMKEMGYVTSSAFEDAALNGGSFSDIMKGLEQDILRVFLRMVVLKPLIESLFGGGASGAPGLLSGLFHFAHGGSFTVGGSGGTDSSLVAFKATPGETVSVSRPDEVGSGSGTIVIQQSINVDARSDISSVRAAVAAGGQAIRNQLMREARSGGGFARAVGKA